MPKKIVNDGQAPSIDLSAFTVTLTMSRCRRPTARLCFAGVAHIMLSCEAARMVREAVGETVDVRVNPQDGQIALMPGDERKLVPCSSGGSARKVMVSAIADELAEIYGEHRNVYFDVEAYDGLALLVPNGRVTK